MKKIKSQMFISITLVLLAFVCALNVTYSYFTASASIDGNVNFGDLNIRFAYMVNSSTLPSDKTTISLYPESGTIEREKPFKLSLTEGGTAIDSLLIQKMANSCACYVRFWVDAYVVTETQTDDGGKTTYIVDKTKNYGKYFFLKTNESVYTKSGGSVSGSWCYFVPEAFLNLSAYSIDLGNTLELRDISAAESDKVPVDILGEKLKITLTVEAVQKTNKAYLSVFGKPEDTKGYYTYWS